MSVTFSSNARFDKTTRESPCRCAQMAPNWTYPCEDLEPIRGELRSYARRDCPFCRGTGVDLEPVSDLPELNWCNANAAAMLRMLGLTDEPYGEVALPEARRAIMRASNRSDVATFARPEEVITGAPRVNGAVVELRPLRMVICGLSADQIQDRLQAFADFVNDSAARGATKIFWG